MGQLFDAAGNAVGGEFPVGGITGDGYGYGAPPVVTELASGGFVAIWRPEAAPSAVAQIYDSSGAPVGSTFELPNVYYQFTADSLPSGGFVVTSLYNNSVLTQTFDSQGTQQQVFAFSEGSTYDYLPAPAVTSLPSGGFVVSYSRDPGTYRYDLVAQVYQADGTPVAPEFVVAADLDPEGASPATLTSLASGGFVISWASSPDPTLYDYAQIDVMAQIFDAAGNALGAAFMVHSETAGYQRLPDITALSSGGFVVAWTEDGSLNGRVFDATGNMVGGEFQATSDMATSWAGEATSLLSISALASGDFVVAWTDLSGDGSGTSVRSQIFTQTDVYSGTPGNDVQFGTPGDDQIDGLGGNDYLEGAGGDDTLNGGEGDDWLDGGEGDDSLSGGIGNDWAIYNSAGAGVSLDLSLTTAQATGGAGSDTLASIENISGSAFNDALTGNAQANFLGGREGDDVLAGGGGNDILAGGTGADSMSGGDGSDVYRVDDAGDIVTELAAQGFADTVRSTISYTLGDNLERLYLNGTAAIDGTGNALGDIITGNGAANTLTGLGGNDRLDGGGGADTMAGGTGNDLYIVNDAGDVVTEAVSQGNDLVQASLSYTLSAYVEGLRLIGAGDLAGTGNGRPNSITGNAAANVLRGERGNDVLLGGGGDDDLHGGLGNDRLTGGSGADDFIFDTRLSAWNVDRITDFSAADDTLQLDLSVFTGIAAGTLAAEAFHLGTAAADADDRIVYDSATGNIYYDADGNGAGAQVLFATVTAGTVITNADFVAY